MCERVTEYYRLCVTLLVCVCVCVRVCVHASMDGHMHSDHNQMFAHILDYLSVYRSTSHYFSLTTWHFAEKKNSQAKLGDSLKDKTAGVADEKFARTGNQLVTKLP